MKLDGTVAIITGASRGIGRATATALSHRGASVGLIARSADQLREVTESLPGPSARTAADVGDAAAVTHAVHELTAELGDIDILVNNAGVGAYGAVLEEDPSIHERLMRVNYLGTVHATLAVLPGMTRRRRGHIVNVASVAGRLGAPFEAAYSASKFAVVGWSEALAAEVGQLGISMSLVNPGPVHTSFAETRGVPYQRKYPRPLRPEKVAAAVVSAIEADRFEQTMPRWLRMGIITRALSSGMYRRGLLRDSADDSLELGVRLDTG